MAYPSGGGSYSVSKANFGRLASLVAASALLIDYILTVAVSISSASEQIVAALPGLHDLQVEIAVAAIVLVTLGNLRGLRESGNIFAIPTYLFVGAALLMIGIGAWQILVWRARASRPGDRRGHRGPRRASPCCCCCSGRSRRAPWRSPVSRPSPPACPRSSHPSHATPPRTLAVMAGLLAFLFVGITFLASWLRRRAQRPGDRHRAGGGPRVRRPVRWATSCS